MSKADRTLRDRACRIQSPYADALALLCEALASHPLDGGLLISDATLSQETGSRRRCPAFLDAIGGALAVLPRYAGLRMNSEALPVLADTLQTMRDEPWPSLGQGVRDGNPDARRPEAEGQARNPQVVCTAASRDREPSCHAAACESRPSPRLPTATSHSRSWRSASRTRAAGRHSSQSRVIPSTFNAARKRAFVQVALLAQAGSPARFCARLGKRASGFGQQ